MPSFPRKSRKKHAPACWSCRKRKVRCDATVNTTCTRCVADGFECTLPTARRKLGGPNLRSETLPAFDSSSANNTESMMSKELELRDASGESVEDPPNNGSLCPTTSVVFDDLWGRFATENDMSSQVLQHAPMAGRRPNWEPRPLHHQDPSAFLETVRAHDCSLGVEEAKKWTSFRSYSFLQANAPEGMDSIDYTFLERRGCFMLPDKSILDKFIHEYFSYVHPMLPVIDEAEFWTNYREPGLESNSQRKPMSLFVFQAMLAASSLVMSLETLQNCGFTDVRDARLTFCKRAKVLFDLQTEECPIAIVQGALLLSLSSRHDDKRQGNRLWLRRAIDCARLHRMHLKGPNGLSQGYLTTRLWWCCVVQDRFMSMMSRRPIQITPEVFDTSKAVTLTTSDFRDTAFITSLFPEYPLHKLEYLFLLQVRLADVLSSVSATVYPPNGVPSPKVLTMGEYSALLDQLGASKSALYGWLESQPIAESQLANAKFNKPALLFYNVLMMTYHAAHIALNHCEIQTAFFNRSLINMVIIERLCVARQEIYHHSVTLCEITDKLSSLDLVSKLPVLAPAFTVIPFLLIGLGAKVPSADALYDGLVRFQRTLTEAMELYQSKWTGIKNILEGVSRLVPPETIREDLRYNTDTHATHDQFLEWEPSNLFEKHHILYLRATIPLNFLIEKGLYVENETLPEYLRMDIDEEKTESARAGTETMQAVVV